MILGFFCVFLLFCLGGHSGLPAVLQIVAVDLLLCAGIFLFAKKTLGYSFKTEMLSLRLLPLLIAYAGALLPEIVKANFLVAARICRKGQPQGQIVTFDSHLETSFARLLLGNAITLTPGTITMHTEGRRFTVHMLDPSFGGDFLSSSSAKIVKRIDRAVQKNPRSASEKPRNGGKENR